MRIMHFCPSQSFSGLEHYALELAAAQKETHHEVTFVVHPGSELEHQCKKRGINTWQYNGLSLFETLTFHKAHPGFFKEFDAVHLHSTQEVQRFFYFWTLQKMMKKPKIILQIHLWINHSKKNPLHRLTYNVVDEVWCSSLPAKKSLLQNLPVPEKKIKIINYGRPVQKIENSILSKEEARKKLGLPQDITVIGTVSRIEKSKGIKELMEAFAEIVVSNPELHLVVIGGASPQNPSAEKYFKELRKNRPENTYFMGVMLESYKYLKAFDLYILPSYEECFSLSLLDAQLAQLPVVGTDAGGTPELVCPGKTGWLVKPRSTKALKDGILHALKEKDKWAEYGAAGYPRVKHDFNQEQIFQQILDGYGK